MKCRRRWHQVPAVSHGDATLQPQAINDASDNAVRHLPPDHSCDPRRRAPKQTSSADVEVRVQRQLNSVNALDCVAHTHALHDDATSASTEAQS